MPSCCVCGKDLSNGSFNLKDKFELLAHAFICKECANKIGIKSMWSASLYTAEKAKKKYFEMYPAEKDKMRSAENVDQEQVRKLINAGKNAEAYQYVRDTAGTGQYGVSDIISKSMKNTRGTSEEFVKKIQSIPHSDTTWTQKEVLYLETVLRDGEEVLHTVSGLMSQNNVSVSGNYRESAQRPSASTRTWLLVLTDKRVIMINRHLLVGTEYIEIPLDTVNAVSMQSRLMLGSISIMHGSGGILVDNVIKENGASFVAKANEAIENIKKKNTDRIVEAINSSKAEKTTSVADEIKKFKELLDIGAITQEEFEEQKGRLLGK